VQLSDAISCFLLLATAERRLSPRTVTLYGEALARLQDYAATNRRVRLTDFTANLVRGAAAREMQEGRAANWQGGHAMAATIISASRTMVRRLRIEYPDLPLPDLSVLRAPKAPVRIQPRLEDGEFAALESALRRRLLRERVPRFLVARDTAILEVLANTGLRANECCGLDIDDIDLDEGCLRVRRTKNARWRILTVADPDEPRDGGEVVRALQDYLRYRERLFGPSRTPALWLTIRGNRLSPNSLRVELSRLCDEAGIDGNRPPHAFRRAHFTEQYRAQPTALPVLVERMGWSGEAMAKVYTRGVDVELARRVPLPLVSKAWRSSGPKVPVTPRGSRPILSVGVGSGGGGADAPALPTVGTRDRDRRASVSPRRGPRL
jgi:integrase